MTCCDHIMKDSQIHPIFINFQLNHFALGLCVPGKNSAAVPNVVASDSDAEVTLGAWEGQEIRCAVFSLTHFTQLIFLGPAFFCGTS